MAIIQWEDPLKKAQDEKKAELNRLCNQTILGRFSSVVNGITYYFSCDGEAQSNFEKLKGSFKDGTLTAMGRTTIGWTAYDETGAVVRLQLTEELFMPVYIDHLLHIEANISKLRDFLEPLIDGCERPEDVALINWN